MNLNNEILSMLIFYHPKGCTAEELLNDLAESEFFSHVNMNLLYIKLNLLARQKLIQIQRNKYHITNEGLQGFLDESKTI